MNWFVDTTIDLSAICELRDWILSDVIADLLLEGIAAPDAEAFARYVFRVHANGPGQWPRGMLTEAQWDRLTYDGEHPG
jgi:hypothetical protein